MSSMSTQQMEPKCPACGGEMPPGSIACPSCGYGSQQPAPATAAPEKKKTVLPVVGGALLLVTGVLGIVIAVLIMSASSFFEDLGGLVGVSGLGNILIALGAIFLIFSLVVVIGGYFAVKRRRFGMAIVAGVLALIVGLFTPYMIGSVLGLVGLILIAVAHSEFS